MDDGREVACCQHGMAGFPQWHRLFTRQMEVALYRYVATFINDQQSDDQLPND
jgi:hypothetical protein